MGEALLPVIKGSGGSAGSIEIGDTGYTALSNDWTIEKTGSSNTVVFAIPTGYSLVNGINYEIRLTAKSAGGQNSNTADVLMVLYFKYTESGSTRYITLNSGTIIGNVYNYDGSYRGTYSTLATNLAFGSKTEGGVNMGTDYSKVKVAVTAFQFSEFPYAILPTCWDYGTAKIAVSTKNS